MEPAEVPTEIFVQSAIASFSKAHIEVAVIYTTTDENGNRVTGASSNKGPEGLARAARALKIGNGAVEQAAIAMHGFRIGEEGKPIEFDVCYVCHLGHAWDALDDVDKEGHRALVKVVLGTALAASATTTAPLVQV
jgi:hypothetical protein